MTDENLTTVDKAVMLVTGAIFVIAMPVIGLIVTLAGSMSPMVTYMTGESSGYALSAGAIPEGAQVATTPLVGPNARAALIAVALVLFGLLAIYKLFQPGAEPTGTVVGDRAEN
jgi:uncharacterized membrane protein